MSLEKLQNRRGIMLDWRGKDSRLSANGKKKEQEQLEATHSIKMSPNTSSCVRGCKQINLTTPEEQVRN